MGEVAAVASMALRMAQEQSQAKAQAKQVAARENAAATQAYQQQAAEDHRRQERLRQDQATQRARFGAGGVGGGSAQAVLDGMRARTERDAAEDRSILDARFGDQARNATSRNILEEQRTRRKTALLQFLTD